MGRVLLERETPRGPLKPYLKRGSHIFIFARVTRRPPDNENSSVSVEKDVP